MSNDGRVRGGQIKSVDLCQVTVSRPMVAGINGAFEVLARKSKVPQTLLRDRTANSDQLKIFVDGMVMNNKTPKPQQDSPAVVLIHKAIEGESSISSSEWDSIPIDLLCAAAILLFGRFLELGLMAMDNRTENKDEIRNRFMDLITDQSHDLETQVLRTIAESARAAELVDEAKSNRATYRDISDQINERAFKQSPATAIMMLARFAPTRSEVSVREIQQALKIASLKDFQSLQDPADFRQEAILGAVKRLKRIWDDGWKNALSDRKPPDEPRKMFSPILDSPRWDRTELYRMAGVWVNSCLRPLFTEHPKTLQRAARENYREALERRDAKKRGGRGSRHSRAAGKSQERPVFVDLDDVSEQLARPADAQLARETRMLEVVRARLGDKAVLYFQELSCGATAEAAAKAAGISTSMGRRYKRKMPEYERKEPKLRPR